MLLTRRSAKCLTPSKQAGTGVLAANGHQPPNHQKRMVSSPSTSPSYRIFTLPVQINLALIASFCLSSPEADGVLAQHVAIYSPACTPPTTLPNNSAFASAACCSPEADRVLAQHVAVVQNLDNVGEELEQARVLVARDLWKGRSAGVRHSSTGSLGGLAGKFEPRALVLRQAQCCLPSNQCNQKPVQAAAAPTHLDVVEQARLQPRARAELRQKGCTGGGYVRVVHCACERGSKGACRHCPAASLAAGGPSSPAVTLCSPETSRIQSHPAIPQRSPRTASWTASSAS